MGGERVYFLTKPEYFRAIFITMGGWQSIGFQTIIYTSALCGIDSELYEAARIDGANKIRQILSITFTSILPTIAIMLIMNIGNLLNVGSDAIILLYQPITYETADIISSYVYRTGLVESNYSFSTAVGMFNGIISFILVISANKISNKIGNVGMW
jgi:putative aldouronate transport system permease protein